MSRLSEEEKALRAQHNKILNRNLQASRYLYHLETKISELFSRNKQNWEQGQPNQIIEYEYFPLEQQVNIAKKTIFYGNEYKDLNRILTPTEINNLFQDNIPFLFRDY